MKHISHITIKSFLFAGIFTFLFLAGCTIYFFIQKNTIKNNVYPNVYIDNINFGGKNRAEIEAYFNKKNQVFKNIKIQLSYREDIATFSGELLKLGYDSKTLAQQAYLIGRSSNPPSNVYQRIKSIFKLGSFHFESSLSLDSTDINDFLSMLEDKYNKPAENALFQYEDGRVTAFKIEKNGLKILKKETEDTIESTLKQIGNKPRNKYLFPIKEQTIKPEITLASSNKFGIAEEIGTGISDYSGSIPGRVANVILASSKFNGVIIPKGEEFSFNKIIGDISAASGYQQAYIIQNGRTVLGDGGGVCQVSTTIFRAALNTGLPITERHAHAYRVHYYENDQKPGFDATIFTPSVDFKFINDTPAAILIQTEILKDTNQLIFRFYGKKDSRKVELSDSTVFDNVSAPEAIRQDDPTLKKGVVKQVDWAAPGAKSTFHYRVTNNGQITQDRDFLSVYRPWAAVYLVGTAD